MAEVMNIPSTPESTEVRCQEKTRGGLKYEVILGEAEAKVNPPKIDISPKINLSVEDIEEKLKAAEERRQQIELGKMSTWTAKLHKIEEASRKKDEQTTHFILQTKEALNQKMETHTEKREAHINDLKTKLKDHIENVERTRQSLDQQTEEIRLAMEDKLQSANALRDENLKKMLERLREHKEQVEKVRTTNTLKLQQLEETVQEKLEHAQKRRDQLEQEQKEKLRNHHNRTLEMKQTVESTIEVRKTEVSALLESKLTIADQKREKEIQRKLEAAKKYEKRAEVVRQNKANILATKESSG